MTTAPLLALMAALSLGSPIDELTYKQLAREAANRKFLAQLEEGEAAANVIRATQKERRAAGLYGRNAGSYYDHADAVVALMQVTFARKRARYHVEEAEMIDRLWRLRADWSRAGATPDARRLARLLVELRQARLRIVNELVRDVGPYLARFEERLRSSQDLLRRNALSRDDFEAIENFTLQARGLATEADAERTRAIAEVAEAEADVNALPVAPPRPVKQPPLMPPAPN